MGKRGNALNDTDYYGQLEVSRQATMIEIRQAYRGLAKRYHPDVNHGNPEAESKFKRIVEAYEVLSDEKLRAAYDAKLAQAGGTSGQSGSRAREGQGKSGINGMASAKSKAESFDPAAVQKHFEHFFGMSPKRQTDTQKVQKEAKEKNPLDSSAMFNHFFGYRKNN